jgi:hypothetical protein
MTSSSLVRSLLAAAAVLAGCSSPSSPAVGEGNVVATLPSNIQPFGVALSGGDPIVASLGGSPATVQLYRVHGGVTTPVAIGPVDWGDFGASCCIENNPQGAFGADAANAYFLGAHGVTIVPLDGSRGAVMRMTAPGNMGGFTVDAGTIYACFNAYSESELVRFRTDGSSEILARADRDGCLFGALAVDDEAVYWPSASVDSTKVTVHRWNKQDGVSAIVTTLPWEFSPNSMSVSGAQLVMSSSGAVVKVDKHGGDAATLDSIAPHDPAIFSTIADATYVYVETEIDVRRVPLAGGAPEVVARKDAPAFMGVALDGAHVYFASHEQDGTVTLRSVGR